MAFNPYQTPSYVYNPSGYNQYQQPYYQAQTYQQPSGTGSMLTVFIDSEHDVDDYPVAAGTTVLLLSFKQGKFYLKSTGTNGVPQPVRIFTFTEESKPISATSIQNGAVSRDEFDALSEKLNKLISELGGNN